MRILSLLFVTAVTTAQSPLSTTFANNGAGAVGGMVYYDLDVLDPAGVTITSLELNMNNPAGIVATIDVFLRPGTRVGFQSSFPSWVYMGPGTVTTAGPGLPSAVVLFSPIQLSGGTTTGWALGTSNVAHAYTNGGGAVPLVYSNADLMLSAGEASNVPFSPVLFSPRVVNANHYYTIGGTSPLATNTTLGQGCGSFASTYESFGSAAAFDLSNTSMTWTPAGPGYTVSSGGSFLPIGSVSAPQILSFAAFPEVTVPLTAMGSFPAATGVLTSLTICENGFVSAAPGNGTGFTPSIAQLLNGPQTIWATWHDFAPLAGGTIEFEQSATVSMVTWNDVLNFGGSGPLDRSTMQIQFHSSGVVRWCWQTMSPTGNGYLVGYSPGGSNQDPGNTDYSMVLPGGSIALGPFDQTGIVLTALTRPILGTNWFLELTNIPPTAVFILNIFGTADPGILDLAFFGMPRCQLRASLDLVQGPLLPGPVSPSAFAIPSAPPLLGFELFTQGVVSQVPPVNAFGAITSNGVKGRLGPL